jgi:hypothetical protein
MGEDSPRVTHTLGHFVFWPFDFDLGFYYIYAEHLNCGFILSITADSIVMYDRKVAPCKSQNYLFIALGILSKSFEVYPLRLGHAPTKD